MNNQAIAEIVISLCNHSLSLDDNCLFRLPELSDEEWVEILTFASRQGVLPIIAQQLNGVQIRNEQAKDAFIRKLMSAQNNGRKYQMRLKVMRDLAMLFAKEGIDVMYLKGATLSQLYPDPHWRVFSDIDYYLYGESAKGIEAMARHGIKNSAYYHHHTQASFQGILLENHYDFVERVNHKCDIGVDDELKELAEKEGRCVRASYLGEDIRNAYVMTPTMNAIFLMRHMSAHFASETVSLRMLYDWTLFIRRHAKEVDWSLVTSIYTQAKITMFAGVLTEIIRTHLKQELSDYPVKTSSPALSEKVWDSIVNPPQHNPHKKSGLRYFIYEGRTFLSNKWKHQLVYPGDSYALMFLQYAWNITKKKLGLLKMEER